MRIDNNQNRLEHTRKRMDMKKILVILFISCCLFIAGFQFGQIWLLVYRGYGDIVPASEWGEGYKSLGGGYWYKDGATIFELPQPSSLSAKNLSKLNSNDTDKFKKLFGDYAKQHYTYQYGFLSTNTDAGMQVQINYNSFATPILAVWFIDPENTEEYSQRNPDLIIYDLESVKKVLAAKDTQEAAAIIKTYKDKEIRKQK
jgi:hypothetical protein